MVFAASGCQPSTRLKPRFLPGFVPGSQQVFRPVRVGVAPTAGAPGSGEVTVGQIFDADGATQKVLVLRDPRTIFGDMLIEGLKAAGLTPIRLDSAPPPGKLENGTDFILSAELERIEVNKRFGAEETVHGQYFSMNAVVTAKFELRNREGRMLYSGEVSGIENEPPAPVGKEVFLPLETEPSESVSVALSRAIGSLITEPGFRRALPLATDDGAGLKSKPK